MTLLLLFSECDVILVQANATGRSSKTVREYLEKNYSEEGVASSDGCVRLAVSALLEVVQSGAKNIEIAVMERGGPMRLLDNDAIEAVVAQIEADKAAEASEKKK